MYLATPQAKFGEQVFSVFKAIPILSGKDAQVVASALRSLAVVPPLSREIMISEGVLEQLTSASAAEFARNAKEAVQKVRDKLLPGVPATQIGELERTWSNIEPILVYASKLANGMRSSTLNYFCDQVRNFGTGWKAHRYDTIRPVVQAQIGHLSEEALSIWKEDRYAPLGQILLANGASEKPARIAGHLESAIRQGHLAGTGDLQSRLNGVLAAEGIDANKIIQLVSTLQSELEIIDRVIGSQAGAQIEKRLKWLDGRVDKLGMVPVNNKIRENLKELSCFLNEEAKAALELTWSDAEREKQSKISLNEVFPAHFREQLREHVDYLLGDLERLGSEPTFKALFPGSVPNDKVLGEMRRSRKVLGDISRLLQLTADEVSVDRFRDVDDQPVSLSSTIEKLKTFCGNGSPFRQDLDNVAFVLLEGDSGLQTESRRLALVFTDDPELLLQIGKYPLGCGSCQHFDGSVSFNSTLASAVGDAHIKASYIIDLNRLPQEWIAKIDQKDFDTVGPSVPRIHLLNAAVARFLVKSLPVGLFMEPTYTQTNKTDRTLDATINQVMERMLAVPMKKNLLRGGGGDRVDVPASGNPSGQYEDNDALRIQIGPYRMSAQVVSKGKE
jgi:hypothetical protein